MPASVMMGDASDEYAMLYSTPHQNTLNFLQEQMEQASQRIVGAGQAFYQRATSIFDRFNSEEAIQQAKAARRAHGSIWDMDEISALTDLDSIRSANNAMRRWVMANPTVRRLSRQQLVEGYDGYYKDPFPDDTGEEHYDYRRVMNGIVVDKVDEEGEDYWEATTYLDDLLPDDHELDIEEQVDILSTWKAVENLIKRKKEDPVSVWGADLS